MSTQFQIDNEDYYDVIQIKLFDWHEQARKDLIALLTCEGIQDKMPVWANSESNYSKELQSSLRHPEADNYSFASDEWAATDYGHDVRVLNYNVSLYVIIAAVRAVTDHYHLPYRNKAEIINAGIDIRDETDTVCGWCWHGELWEGHTRRKDGLLPSYEDPFNNAPGDSKYMLYEGIKSVLRKEPGQRDLLKVWSVLKEESHIPESIKSTLINLDRLLPEEEAILGAMVDDLDIECARVWNTYPLATP